MLFCGTCDPAPAPTSTLLLMFCCVFPNSSTLFCRSCSFDAKTAIQNIC
jgi:hypothetical protein